MTTTRLLARLLTEGRGTPRRLALASLALAFLAGAQLALTWVVKAWVEGPLVSGGAGAGRLGLAAAGLVAIVAVALVASRALLAAASQRILASLRQRTLERLLSAPLRSVRTFGSGDLSSRVLEDAGVLSGIAENLVRRLLGDGLVGLGAVVMMVVLDARLALAVFLAAPVCAALLAAAGGAVRRWGLVAREEGGALASLLAEQLAGLSTIKGFQTESSEAARFAAGNERYRARVLGAELWASVLIGGVFLAVAGALVGAVAWGTGLVSHGTLSAGALLAFCLYAGQTIEPARRLAEVHGLLQRSLASAERLYALLDLAEPEDGDPSPAGPPPSEAGAIALRFEDVAFRFEPGAPVFDGFDLAVAAGERLAIAGASGAGKTTMTRLLVRHLAPDRGRILLDGRDLASIAPRAARRLVTVVEPEPFLFAGTLRENVTYGSPAATPEALEAALEATGLHPLVSSLPRGLATPLAEAGRSLSTGQRQRIAIARAILREPALLVLDEATAALDGDAEETLFVRLGPWLARRTVIVLAHRLSTLRRERRLVVLGAGRVLDDGPFERLAASSAVFRALHGAQDPAEPATETAPALLN